MRTGVGQRIVSHCEGRGAMNRFSYKYNSVLAFFVLLFSSILQAEAGSVAEDGENLLYVSLQIVLELFECKTSCNLSLSSIARQKKLIWSTKWVLGEI